MRYPPDAVALGWVAATLFSGIPSTAITALSGGDLFETTRAAGQMLLPGEQDTILLFFAALAAHGGISFFWALILGFILPHRYVVLWSMVSAAIIALVDL